MGELALHPDNVIQLWTRNGDCEIQLLSGDITRLPVAQKMDILMVSAFPGDYSPMHGTVIGSLLYNLGISVDKLSYHKDLDLRHHFSCWLSKPITTQDSPFGRLLCFERRRGNFTVAQQISDMFRVFVPVFNNQENTVITPLLATGHQGFNKAGICGAMVDAAAHWIRAGLPLRCLKIVMYEGITQDVRRMFEALKAKLMAQNEKLKRSVFSKTYDVYISFSPTDDSWVQKIKTLFEKKESIKVYAKHQDFDKDKVWQNNIFKVMVACKRIIAVLTPAFLDSSECLEQYNMAMCCNRLVGMEVLAPFYVQTVPSIPTYMGLVQWVDCRVRKEGDSIEEKLTVACSDIVSKLDDTLLSPGTGGTIQVRKEGDSIEEKLTVACSDIVSKLDDTLLSPGTGGTIQYKIKQLTPTTNEARFKYDVFISYSHKDPQQAEALLQAFGEIDEMVRVFYDRSELTTGSNWQNMLYQCLGQARCVIALVSPTYLSSTVCLEEYNIALARFLTKDEKMQFIPVCISDIDSIPAAFAQIKMLDARGDNFTSAKEKLAKAVVDFLQGESPRRYMELLNTVQLEFKMESLLNDMRSQEVHKQYTVTQKDGLQRNPPLKIDNKDERPLVLDEDQEKIEDFDIVMTYANDAQNLAGAFCYLIDKMYTGLKISVLTQASPARLKAFDQATRLVMFISRDFLKTEHFMHELHQALSRQRPEKKRIVYLIKVNAIPTEPFFASLLPYDISLVDKAWFDLERKYIKGNKRSGNKRVVSTSRMKFAGNFSCDYAEYFAMTKAAEDVLESILYQGGETKEAKPNQINITEVESKVVEDKKSLIGRKYTLAECLKETPCILEPTESPEHKSSRIDATQKKVEIQSHVRPGTPELANDKSAKLTNEKRAGGLLAANEKGDGMKRESQVFIEHPGTRHNSESEKEVIIKKDLAEEKANSTNEKRAGSPKVANEKGDSFESESQAIVEHPGTRWEKEREKIVIIETDFEQENANSINERRPGSPELANDNGEHKENETDFEQENTNSTNERRPGSPELANDNGEHKDNENVQKHKSTKQETETENLENNKNSRESENVNARKEGSKDTSKINIDKFNKQTSSKSCVLI